MENEMEMCNMKLRPVLNLFVLLACVGFGLPCVLEASDFHAPLLALEGPVRFIVEVDGRDDSSVKFWSTVSFRKASEGLMDHGTSGVGMSSLIFNEAAFRVADIFSDSYVPSATEAYLPLLRTARVFTHATYSEQAIVFGAQWMYPVYEDRGRFGIRARVPYRYAEIEREDLSGVPGGAQLEDVVAVQPVAAIPNGTGAAEILPADQSRMMRFDFAEALTQSNDLNLVFNFDAKPMLGSVELSALDSDNKVTAQKRLAVVHSPLGQIPRVPDVPTNVAVALKVPDIVGVGPGPVANQIPASYVGLPADGKIAENKVYVFDSTAGKYRGLLDDNAVDATTRRANQRTKESMWLIPFGYETTAGVMSMAGTKEGGSMYVLNDLTARVTENVYQWFHARGYDFEGGPRQGVGDVEIEAFYQQDFVPDMTGEITVGVKIPIDRDRQFFKTPYKARLSNGGHWEAIAGGGVGFTLKKLLNVKMHGRYAFVLPEIEEVCATFKGSTIKGIGPREEASIEWSYATFNVDCTLFHPDSHTCSGVIGYQLYWKGRDKVAYKNAQAESWLGKKYNKNTSQFEANLIDLDSTLLALNTDRIAHRLRAEFSLRIGSYCEILFGGAYTIAGKHVARDLDTHFGVHLTF